MSDLDKIKAALRGAAMDGWPTGPVATPATFLRYVNRSVLPQKLTLVQGNETVLTMIATGRRLLRVLPLAHRALAAHSELFNRPALGPEDGAAIADLLATAFSLTPAPILQGDPANDPGELGGGGLSVEVLRAALDVPDDDDGPQPFVETVDGFVGAGAVAIRTAIWIDDDGAQVMAGSDAEAESLAAWAEATINRLLDTGSPLAGAFETEGTLVFGAEQDAAGHILLAGRLGQFFVCHLHGTDTASSLSHWRGAMA